MLLSPFRPLGIAKDTVRDQQDQTVLVIWMLVTEIGADQSNLLFYKRVYLTEVNTISNEFAPC